jgi:hypothetical protein
MKRFERILGKTAKERSGSMVSFLYQLGKERKLEHGSWKATPTSVVSHTKLHDGCTMALEIIARRPYLAPQGHPSYKDGKTNVVCEVMILGSFPQDGREGQRAFARMSRTVWGSYPSESESRKEVDRLTSYVERKTGIKPVWSDPDSLPILPLPQEAGSIGTVLVESGQ